jgi:hypothetical protein
MSIINDALKKIEKSVTQNPALPSIREKTGRKFKIPYYLILILIPLAGIFFLKKNAPQPVSAPLTSIPSLPLKNLRLQPEEKKSAPPVQSVSSGNPDSPFTLNGVFFSEGQGYALINNQIAKENDLIKGAKVVRIGLEEVELKIGDETITLKGGT